MEFFHDFCVMKKMIESWQLLSVDVKTGNFSLLLDFCVVEPPLINLFGRRSYVIICLFGEVGIYDVVIRSLIYKNHFLRFYFALTPFGRTDTKLLVVVALQRKHFIGVVAKSHNVSNHQKCFIQNFIVCSAVLKQIVEFSRQK